MSIDAIRESPQGNAVGAIRRLDVVGVALLALAAYHLALAALMVMAPHTFYEKVGPFGVQNDHYLRDLATYEATFAVALALAWRRPAWRVPVLGLVALQFVLHAINHLVDIDAAHPHWLGPADFVSLAVAAALLVWLALFARRSPPISP